MTQNETVTTGLHVLRVTALCQLQDLGRVGYQSFGVTRCGAMDRISLRLANILAGNPEHTPCLELALAGAVFEVCSRTMRLAFVGDFPLAINGGPVKSNASYTLARGERFTISACRGGAAGSDRFGSHGYLAVAGGFEVKPQMGSCATHARTGLGGFGQDISTGALLPVRLADAPIAPDGVLPHQLVRQGSDKIRVVRGPQDEQFSVASIAGFFSGAFTLQHQSDRMGYKLGGNVIESAGDGSIISEPVSPGSVQVPASGDPIVLMADCGTIGGYPRIATVISVDQGQLAQFTPGKAFYFEEVSLEESQKILQRKEQQIAAFAGR